jgi:hypothetical protein
MHHYFNDLQHFGPSQKCVCAAVCAGAKVTQVMFTQLDKATPTGGIDPTKMTVAELLAMFQKQQAPAPAPTAPAPVEASKV